MDTDRERTSHGDAVNFFDNQLPALTYGMIYRNMHYFAIVAVFAPGDTIAFRPVRTVPKKK